MNKEKKTLGELIGVLAIIASLIFVAFEIRQSNQIAKGTSAFEIMNAFRESNQLVLTNSELRSVLLRKRNGEELSQTENEILRAYVLGIANIWMATEEAYDNGIVSDRLYSVYTNDVASTSSLIPPEQWQQTFEMLPHLQNFKFFEIITKSIDSQNIQK